MMSCKPKFHSKEFCMPIFILFYHSKYCINKTLFFFNHLLFKNIKINKNKNKGKRMGCWGRKNKGYNAIVFRLHPAVKL